MAEGYIRAGFICDLLEPWMEIEGSEWGGKLVAMHDLASRCLGIDDERAVIVTGWMVDDFSRCFEQEWWGLEEELLPEIVKARDTYLGTVEEWRKRAKSFDLPPSELVPNGVDASGTFEATLASLPDWLKPVHPDDRKRAVLLELGFKKHRLEMDIAHIDRQIAALDG